MSSLLVPPASVRGMAKLDRSAFTTVLEVPYLKLGLANLAGVMPTLKKYFLKMEKLKPVQDCTDGKRAYLDPDKVQNLLDISKPDRELLSQNNVKELLKARLTLNYENWRSDQILKAVLPDGIETPTSYSKVGHILHLNLRESQLPQRNLIGQVLLDKVPNARTVVNKLNTIDTTFRHFAMEVLAGDDDTLAIVSESGCTYKFDFARVYWNPRLSTEHASLVSLLKPGDVLYDVFAGVGPFAVPAARKGVRVLANDLNPESFRWLKENVETNKKKVNKVEVFNKDGRDFLREDVKRDVIARTLRDNDVEGMGHIVMNLPGMAVEFLDVFSDWLSEEEVEKVVRTPLTVHLYCFVKVGKGDDPCALGKTLVEEKLQRKLGEEERVSLHNVRNVSPNKEMMRVSFLLTRELLTGEEPAKKRARKGESGGLCIDDDVVGKNGKEQGTEEDQKCLQGGRRA